MPARRLRPERAACFTGLNMRAFTDRSRLLDTTNESLLVRVRNTRDSQSWREFDALYRPVLKRYARARGLKSPDAEDLAQECMRTLVKRLPTFEYCRRKGRFSSWLHTVANNQINKLLSRRRLGRADTSVLKALAQPEDELVLWERVWLREHLKFCLRAVGDEFAPKTMQAFERTVLDDIPVERVCETLGMNRNQVYLARSRVLRKLKEKMSELIGLEG